MNSTIGSAIKLERKKKKLTQKRLGELIGKSGESIKKYESGFTTISIDVLHDIANALEISVQDLYHHPSISIDDAIPDIPANFDFKGFKKAMDGLLALIEYSENDVNFTYNEDQSNYHVSISNPTFKVDLYKNETEKLLDTVMRLINGELYNCYKDSKVDGE